MITCYILENSNSDLSITQISKNTYVSITSFSIFSRKLGYKLNKYFLTFIFELC